MSNTYTDNTREDLYNTAIELGTAAGYTGDKLENFATHYVNTVIAEMPDGPTTKGD